MTAYNFPPRSTHAANEINKAVVAEKKKRRHDLLLKVRHDGLNFISG